MHGAMSLREQVAAKKEAIFEAALKVARAETAAGMESALGEARAEAARDKAAALAAAAEEHAGALARVRQAAADELAEVKRDLAASRVESSRVASSRVESTSPVKVDHAAEGIVRRRPQADRSQADRSQAETAASATKATSEANNATRLQFVALVVRQLLTKYELTLTASC